VYTNEEFEQSYRRYADMVTRVCFMRLKNTADTQDALQEVFLRLLKHNRPFASGEHEKAWLLRVSANVCKDMLKRPSRRTESIDDHPEPAVDFAIDETLEAVWTLPEKYKHPVYLHYYEGYSTAEIAQILRRPHSTVRNQLRDARAKLKKLLGDETL
jgi:RNA polymerase sigma-70 factor (ECF subfamily)